jgi:hypothetical protein
MPCQKALRMPSQKGDNKFIDWENVSSLGCQDTNHIVCLAVDPLHFYPS